MRIAKLKQFIGSTLEQIEAEVNIFFGGNLCPGNHLKTKLYNHNGVYQYEVWYAEFIPDLPSAAPVDVDALIGFEPNEIDGDDWDFIHADDKPEGPPQQVEAKSG